MNDVEQVKEKMDIAEVIGAYVQLKQAGRNLKAPCPFHNEKTASFMVSPEKGIFHCFGCQEGGDVIAFVMKYEGLDFRGALEVLARRAGVELTTRGGDDGLAKKERQRLTSAVGWAVKYFQASLVQNKSALDYAVKDRGLKKQTIQDFQIGYAPDDWNALSQFLLKKNFTTEELKKAGLVGQKQGRTTVYDLYRGRLMFTICDAQGSPVGFTGRVLDDSLPKYLNTPQTALYDKSRVIFGMHLAKQAIRENDEVVLVEGNMDVVASHQAGVRQVIASSGTALTRDQLKSLGRLTKNIKLAFDADAAGLRATERVIELSQGLGITLSMIRLPDAKDPDELIKRDVGLWRQAIADASYVLDYLFDQLATEYDISSVTGKRQYADRLAANLKRLGDPIERDHYTKLLAERIDITEQAVRERVEQADTTLEAPRPPAAQVAPPPKSAFRPEPKQAGRLLEEAVLAINLAFPEVRMSLDDVTPAHFDDRDRQIIVEALHKVGDAPSDRVADKLPNASDYVKILTLRGEEEYNSFAPADRSFEAFELVRRLQINSNKDTKTKLSRKLREAQESGDAQLVHALLTQYQTLIAEED